jgi:hypothetical protein
MEKKASKAASKPKKTTEGKKPAKNVKVTVRGYIPSEEEIRNKAEEIYNNRIAAGEQGTATGDWLKAEEYLKSSRG